MKHLTNLFLVLLWFVGIVISQGVFWSLLAIMFPPWAWYVAVRQFLIYFGVI